MQYKQIIPCDGWFYVADSEGKGDVVMRLAAWALTSKGDVVGLIPESMRDDLPSLVPPPDRYFSTYKHRTELTKWQCDIMGEPYEIK